MSNETKYVLYSDNEEPKPFSSIKEAKAAFLDKVSGLLDAPKETTTDTVMLEVERGAAAVNIASFEINPVEGINLQGAEDIGYNLDTSSLLSPASVIPENLEEQIEKALDKEDRRIGIENEAQSTIGAVEIHDAKLDKEEERAKDKASKPKAKAKDEGIEL